MNISKNNSYQSRFKKMKKSIEENQDLLNEEFPDSVIYSGNHDLLKEEKDHIDSQKEGGQCDR